MTTVAATGSGTQPKTPEKDKEKTITLRGGKKGEGAGLSTPLATAGEAVEIHRRMSADVYAHLDELHRAAHDLSDCCHKLASAFKDYSEVLTNESEPEVAIAHKGTLKLRDFLERIGSIISEAAEDVAHGAVRPYKRLLDTTVEEAHESVRKVERAQATYDAVRKRSSETIAKRKSSTSAAKLKEAQDEQEAARNAFIKSEKEALAAHAIACNVSYIMMPRSFATVYAALSKAADQCMSLTADMEPYNVEFQRAAREFEITDSGSVEQTTTQARKDALTGLVELEQQYLGLLKVLAEIRTKVGTDRTALKVTEEDINYMFNKIPTIAALHFEMLPKLQHAAMASAAESASQLVAEVVSEQIPTMEDLYIPYIENQTRAAAIVETLKKSKHFTTMMKGFEQQCALAGMPVFDFLTMLSTPCRHVAKIRTWLQTVLDNTPTTDRGWNALHDTLEKMSELLDKFDEARKQSEHIKQLLHIKERLPGEDIVDGTRIVLFDSEVMAIGHFIMPPIGPPPPPAASPTMVTASSPQSGSLPALPAPPHALARTSSSLARQMSVPPLPSLPKSGDSSTTPAISPRPPVSPSTASEQQIEPGKPYHMFLFSDLLLIARPHKKSSDQQTYKAIMRLPVQTLAVADLGDQEQGKFAFRVDYPQGALRLAATSVEHREVWVNTLGRAITDRKKTQVFGVPLGELMRRQSERNREVPQILEDAAAYIERTGLEVEGVFRLSSSSVEVARMQCRLDSGRAVKFNEIHNTTGILKAWLRALPAPLLTYELYNDWLDAANDNAKLKTCVARLPRINRYVLASLMGLLQKVAKSSEKNMMDAHNLAVVFAPNILYQRGGGDYLGSSDTCNVVAALITAYEEIFGETNNEQQALRAGASAKKTEATHNRRERLRRLASKKEIVPAGMELPPPQHPLLSIPPPATPPPSATDATDVLATAATSTAGSGVALAFHLAPPMSEASTKQLLQQHSSMTVLPPPVEGSASGTEHASEISSSTGSLHAAEPGPPPTPPPPIADAIASPPSPSVAQQPPVTTSPIPGAEEGDGGEGPEHKHRTKHRHSKRPSGSEGGNASPASPVGASPNDPSPLVMSTAEKPTARKAKVSTGSIRTHGKHRQQPSGNDASEGASASAAGAPATSTDADVTSPTPQTLHPLAEPEGLVVVSPTDTLPTVPVQSSVLDDSLASLPEAQPSPATSVDTTTSSDTPHLVLPSPSMLASDISTPEPQIPSTVVVAAATATSDPPK